MPDPRIISLDIETYGKADWLPPQTCFAPRRSLIVDGIPLKDLVITCAITMIKTDPRNSGSPGSTSASSSLPAVGLLHLSAFSPGETLVLDLCKPDHRRILYRWLLHADTLMGCNLAFDIQNLRAFDPLFRDALSGRHLLIDLMPVNFIESDVRPERGLKTIGLALNTHTYAEETKHTMPTLEAVMDYNGEDTHNTVTDIARLAQRVLQRFPNGTPKLSPWCLQFYSDTIWSCVAMSEAGVPIHRPSLLELYEQQVKIIDELSTQCAFAGLLLSGKGSNTTGAENSKPAFLAKVLEAIQQSGGGDPLQDPLIQITPVTGKLSWSDLNRSLLRNYLPKGHEYAQVLSWADDEGHAQKLLSTYLFPYLFRARKPKKNKPVSRNQILVPQPGVNTCPIPFRPEPPCLTCSEQPGPDLSIPTLAMSSPSATSTSPTSNSSTTHKGKGRRKSPAKQAAESGSASPSLWDLLAPSTTGASTPTSSTPASSSSPTLQPSSTRPGSERSTPSYSTVSSTNRFLKTGEIDPDVWLSHMSWFVVPMQFGDSGGGEGGTQQGRITCKNGAHQTDPDEIQACYRSRWKGGTLVSKDASQLEIRTAGVLSGEASYLAAYNATPNQDLHGRRAISTWGSEALLKSYPELRSVPVDLWRDTCKGFKKREGQVGKRINFADLFRAGAATMRSSVLKDVGEIFELEFFERIRRSRATERPGLWAWQERVIKEAHDTGLVQLPFTGQSRAFMGGEDFEINEIVNFPVQTTAANAMIRIQAFVWRRIKAEPGIKICLSVYDSHLFDCRTARDVSLLNEIYAEAVDWVQTKDYWHMVQDHYGFRVPLVCDSKLVNPQRKAA